MDDPSNNMVDDVFNKSLKLTKFALWLAGIDLYKEKPRFNASIFFYFNIIWLHSDVAGEYYALFDLARSGSSFAVIMLIAPFPFISTLSTIKAASVFYNKGSAVYLVEKLEKLQPKRKYVSKIIDKTVSLLSEFVIFMCSAIVLDAILFCSVPLISMWRSHRAGKMEYKLPYYVDYPLDPFSLPWWPFEYSHQLGSSAIVCCNLFGSDSLFYAFCLYLKMHFNILCYDMERFSSDIPGASKKIRELAQRHQELINLVDYIQKIYSKSMLCNIIVSSFIICFCGFNIMFVSDPGTVFAFFNFTITCTYQIFMMCFFGDMIRESSNEVGEAIYKSNWYNGTPTVKKSVYIIIMRAHVPCSLSAENFATLDLNTFTTIMCRSWSYLAVLKTMYS